MLSAAPHISYAALSKLRLKPFEPRFNAMWKLCALPGADLLKCVKSHHDTSRLKTALLDRQG